MDLQVRVKGEEKYDRLISYKRIVAPHAGAWIETRLLIEC
jgi:hypothetical protein